MNVISLEQGCVLLFIMTFFFFFLQHTRFVQECKDAEPDVLFVGDSLVQLMQQFEVRQDICHSTPGPLIVQVAVAFLCDIFLNLNIFAQFSRCNSSLSALVSYLILVAQV